MTCEIYKCYFSNRCNLNQHQRNKNEEIYEWLSARITVVISVHRVSSMEQDTGHKEKLERSRKKTKECKGLCMLSVTCTMISTA